MSRPSETRIPAVLLHAVMWRRVDAVSLDFCRVTAVAGGYALGGRVLAVLDGSPIEAHYNVWCDDSWHTRFATAVLLHDAAPERVELRRDDDGVWWHGDDGPLDALQGVADVDFAITPATNTLPIRRLTLEVGESRATDAAWIRFPELTVERLPQRYTRIDESRYRYESRGGAFTAELEVDAAGLVVRYGTIWERVAPGA